MKITRKQSEALKFIYSPQFGLSFLNFRRSVQPYINKDIIILLFSIPVVITKTGYIQFYG